MYIKAAVLMLRLEKNIASLNVILDVTVIFFRVSSSMCRVI